MDPLLGQIALWPLSWVPQGWMACEGQLLLIQQYAALFSLLGTTYGGDGKTNFKLPDLRSRVPLGAQVPTEVGAIFGAATASVSTVGKGEVLLQSNQIPLPAHTHSATFASTTATSAKVNVAIPVDAATSDNNVPSNTAVLGRGMVGANPAKMYSAAASTTTLKPFDATANLPAVTGNITVGNSSVVTPEPVKVAVSVPVTVSTLQPSLALRYIIAVEGIYPMRP